MKVVNGLKEYALGEKFVHDGFEYICIPDTGCCVDCDFHEVPVFCNNPNDLACLTQERSDSNRFSFKRLGECQEPKKKTEFAIGEEFQCGFKTLRCVAIDANSPKKNLQWLCFLCRHGVYGLYEFFWSLQGSVQNGCYRCDIYRS